MRKTQKITNTILARYVESGDILVLKRVGGSKYHGSKISKSFPVSKRKMFFDGIKLKVKLLNPSQEYLDFDPKDEVRILVGQ